MSISSPIIPAITPQSYNDLLSQLQKIAGLPEVHVDVADGVFTKNTLWPYHDTSDVTVAYNQLVPFSLEVDLMVEKPLSAAIQWLKAGADQLVFHIETISVAALAEFMEDCPVTVGVAIGSSTPLETLYPYVALVDYVQFMSIATIGSQGQPFDESVLERIATFTKRYPATPVSIDGSVNQTSLPKIKSLGISRYIVGSAIMGADNPKEAYQTLTNFVGR